MQRYKGGSAYFDEAGYARGMMPSPGAGAGFAQGVADGAAQGIVQVMGGRGKQGDPQLGGRPQRNGPAPTPTSQGKFTRVSPGMYRGPGGKIVRSSQNPGASQSPLVGALAEGAAAGAQNAMSGQLGGTAAGMLPGSGQAPQGLGGFRPGQVGSIGQEMGAARGMGGMYTKPAITSGPMGGEPIRQLRPMPNFGAGQIQNGMGMLQPGDQQRFDQMLRYPPGTQPDGSIYGAAMEAAPMPHQRQPMPSVGMIGRNFIGRRPGA